MNYKYLFILLVLPFSCDFKNKNLNSDKEPNDTNVLQKDSIVTKEVKNHTDSSWKEPRIIWCYKLDEKNSFSKGCEKEKDWLDEKIKNLLSTGLPNLIDSNLNVEWNPANELYFFVSVPDIEQDMYADYEKSIEILINDISMPFTLHTEVEHKYGRLLYYKLPVWFWDLEMITKKLTNVEKEKIYGEKHLEKQSSQTTERTLYGFTTTVKRVFKLYDLEDENKIVKTEDQILTKHQFVCAFGE